MCWDRSRLQEKSVEQLNPPSSQFFQDIIIISDNILENVQDRQPERPTSDPELSANIQRLIAGKQASSNWIKLFSEAHELNTQVHRFSWLTLRVKQAHPRLQTNTIQLSFTSKPRRYEPPSAGHEHLPPAEAQKRCRQNERKSAWKNHFSSSRTLSYQSLQALQEVMHTLQRETAQCLCSLTPDCRRPQEVMNPWKTLLSQLIVGLNNTQPDL